MSALQATIWTAVVCFAIGESGRAFARRGEPAPRWAWLIFTFGFALALVHTLLAFDIVHHWSHADAVRSTAAQTEAMFGVAVGDGIYVNYVFFAVWLADAIWWRLAPSGYERPALAVWTLRAFYMVIIFNGIVVFVDGARRIFGLVIVTWLARIWSPGARAAA
jgi:hypothetical protein